MSAFAYRDGVLHIERCDLRRVADAAGTPCYAYAAGEIESRYARLGRAVAPSGADIAYAVKANGNLAVIALLASLGAGADVVSEGELRRALAAGVAPRRILFSGVGKSAAEIAFAVETRIHQINLESETELEQVARAARLAGRRMPVALRVNPDVAAGGHDKIATGRRTDKFGIAADRAFEVYRRMAAAEGLRAVGLAVHIGSQVHDVAAYAAAFDRVAALAGQLRAAALPLERIDLGGGLGVAYCDGDPELDLEAFSGLLAAFKARTGAALTIEPGRYLLATAGVLLTRVITVKRSGGRRWVIVDAAMNDLLRPALYGARHPVRPVLAPDDDGGPSASAAATVAGPVCESGDVLAVDCPLPVLAPGDLVAIGGAGAYGAAMASAYNGRLLVPEVMVRGGAPDIVRRRPSFEESMALERLPDWLDPTAPGGSGMKAEGQTA